MTAGHAGRDLSRISTGPWRAECSLRLCKWMAPYMSKSRVIRAARSHVADDDHDVILIAETTQRVSAPRPTM